VRSEDASRERRRRAFVGVLTGLSVVVAILLLFRNYFGQTLLYGDSNLQWDRTLLDAALAQLAHSWVPAFGAGQTSIISNESTAPITVLQAALSVFGIPLSTLLIYPFLLCVAYAGAWITGRKLSGDRFAAHVVAMFFVGNPWIWDRILLGHVAIIAAAAVVPWMIATIAYRGELGRGFAPVLFAGCGLLLASDPRIAYMAFIGLFVLAIYWFVRFYRSRVAAEAWRAAALVLSPLVAFALNAWWTFPYLTLPGINPVRENYPPLDDVLSYSRYADIWHNVVFSGSFLHFSWDRAAAFGAGSFALWYAAVLSVVLSSLFAKARSVALGWILRVGMLASLTLSLGTSLFPEGATLWMYRHVPFAMLFRDPDKIGFIAIVCCAALLCIRLRDAKPGWRRALALAVVVVALPAVTGDLHTSDGTGLQVFAARADYVNVLGFLRSQPSFPAFRLGIIPPWTAEVSLAGNHPIAEPFVFQYDVPTVDAKLISVGTDATMEAWGIYREIYEGRDPHAGSDLGRLGIKYLLWDDSATLSAGAANTPFATVTPTVIRHAVEALKFPEVYRSGALHVYENPDAGPLLRTLAGPVVSGPVPQAIRAALPAAAIGDTVETIDAGAPLPFASIGIGADRRSACRSQLPRDAMTMAYDQAGSRADWNTYWVDSDYMEQGTGDAYLERELEAFPLPYAFTASRAIVTFPVNVPRDGRIAVSGAVLARPAAVEYAIDNGAWRPLDLQTDLRWVELEPVAPGAHVLTIRGSRVGTVLRALTAAPMPACPSDFLRVGSPQATASASGTWVLASPISMLTVRGSNGHFAFDASNVASATSEPILGPDADAIMIDHNGIVSGKQFPILTGYHDVEFFAKGKPLAAAGWAHWLRGAPTGEPAVPAFSFSSKYSEDDAAATLSGVPITSTVVVHLRYIGDPSNAEVRVLQNGLVIERYALARARLDVSFPAYSDTITILVHRENARGSLKLSPFEAYAGVLLGDGTIDVPSRSVALAHARVVPAVPRPEGAGYGLHFDADNRSLLPTDSIESSVSTRGAGAIFSYAGLHSTRATTCALIATFETDRGPVTRAVADLRLDTRDANGTIDISLLPWANAMTSQLDCTDEHAILQTRGMQLTFYGNLDRATIVAMPASRIAPMHPAAIASQMRSPEDFSLVGHPPNVVWLTSYRPAWRFEANRHLLVNGTMNGWIDTSGSRVTYTIQAIYARYLLLTALAWASLGIWIVFALRRR
jgi:hypothetical protein